jgi:hypothetical protein
MSCYTYADGDDLVIVIKDAKNIPGISGIIGDIIMASTGNAVSRKEEADLKPSTVPEPSDLTIDSDDKFRQVAEDFIAGRYSGGLRKAVAAKLNAYADIVRHQEREDAVVFSEMMDDDESDRFLKNFEVIIPEGKKRRAGIGDRYSSYEEFIRKASLEEKQKLILDFVSKN